MTSRTRTLLIVASFSVVLLSSLAANVLLMIPTLNRLRTTIDNDRASTVVIQQQQSNLTQLTQDLESIEAKQTELETNLWTFIAEDSFFTSIDNLAEANDVTIDSPAIADATPSGSILPRSVTLVIRGKLEPVLETVRGVQSIKPMIAIQQLSIEPGVRAGDVELTLTAATLWK